MCSFSRSSLCYLPPNALFLFIPCVLGGVVGTFLGLIQTGSFCGQDAGSRAVHLPGASADGVRNEPGEGPRWAAWTARDREGGRGGREMEQDPVPVNILNRHGVLGSYQPIAPKHPFPPATAPPRPQEEPPGLTLRPVTGRPHQHPQRPDRPGQEPWTAHQGRGQRRADGSHREEEMRPASWLDTERGGREGLRVLGDWQLSLS